MADVKSLSQVIVNANSVRQIPIAEAVCIEVIAESAYGLRDSGILRFRNEKFFGQGIDKPPKGKLPPGEIAKARNKAKK